MSHLEVITIRKGSENDGGNKEEVKRTNGGEGGERVVALQNKHALSCCRRRYSTSWGRNHVLDHITRLSTTQL